MLTKSPVHLEIGEREKNHGYRYGHTQYTKSINIKMTAFTHIIRRKYENNIALSQRYIGTISRSKK